MASFEPTAFLSFDVEYDGTNPLQHSMRSIGIALFTEKEGYMERFYQNILPQVDDHGIPFPPDPENFKNFWAIRPQLWQNIQMNAVTPAEAMTRLATWLRGFSQFRFVWVAKPANCDWMWLKPYYEKYGPVNKPSIGHYCHDLSALLRAYCLMHHIVRDEDRKRFTDNLAGGASYTHRADDDAVCQGHIYMNLRKLLTHRCSRSVKFADNGVEIQVQNYEFLKYSTSDTLGKAMNDETD